MFVQYFLIILINVCWQTEFEWKRISTQKLQIEEFKQCWNYRKIILFTIIKRHLQVKDRSNIFFQSFQLSIPQRYSSPDKISQNISSVTKSIQNSLADFNYFLLQRVNWPIKKMINVISLVVNCWILSVLHVTFKRH